MANLFRAFLFKLKRDLTFRITLFIGIGMAVIMTLAFLAYDFLATIDSEEGFRVSYCSGQNLLINTLNPANNFGLVIPVLLTVFTVSEFSSGTIRNKIIAGNSKTKIYFSIWLSGLIFTFAVITAYIGLCVALSSIIGGFDANGTIFSTSGLSIVNSIMYNPHINGEFIWKIILSGVVIYIFVISMTVFFSTLFRNVGPCIPIIIVLLIAFSTASLIVNIFVLADAEEEFAQNLVTFTRWVNPLFGLDSYSIKEVGEHSYIYKIEDSNLILHIVCNMIYSTLFTLGGWLIFRKRDVK